MPLDLLAPSLTLVGLQGEISGFGPMDREIERIDRKNILNFLEFPVQRRTGMTDYDNDDYVDSANNNTYNIDNNNSNSGQGKY